jgi:hypothetical protein
MCESHRESLSISMQVKRIFPLNRERDVLLIPAIRTRGVREHNECTREHVSARYGREQDHKYNQVYMAWRRK